MKPQDNIASSFRDSSGFLFYKNNLIYRQVNISYKENYILWHYDKFKMKKKFILHPFIFSIYPILFLLSHNISKVTRVSYFEIIFLTIISLFITYAIDRYSPCLWNWYFSFIATVTTSPQNVSVI